MAHFTLAYWCILLAVLLPIFCAGLSKAGSFGKSPRQGGYDNHNPRAWLQQQKGWRARANAAQANTHEALPFFMAAVVIAHQLQAPQGWLDLLAAAFIALRLLYIGLYVADFAALRSVVWGLALLVNIAILFAGYR